MTRFAKRFAVLAPIFAIACGGGAPEPAAPSTPASASATPPASSGTTSIPTTWSNDMPKDQQMAFMKQNVVPAMTPVFQAHDANRYASFGCATCHGPEYKNPHDYLPHLAMKGGQITAFAEKHEIAKFMATSVVPKMAGAMGEPPYDMKTNQGFGCGGCHKIDMQ